MLSFFRRLISSRIGIIVAFGILGLIAFAFAAADVTDIRSNGLASSDGGAATIGDAQISAAELKERAQAELDALRQERPTLDMNQFIAGGGLDGTLERLINGLALEQFGKQQGMVVSKKVIDGQIASIPSLQGPDGKFSQRVYEQLLGTRKLTDAQVRADVARGVIGDQLTSPTIGASQVASELALPYASLLLEKRDGLIGFIPTRAMGAGELPTDVEISNFYKRNIARYTIPERRVIRYTTITAEQVKATGTPSEAEIAQAYQKQSARFGASEKRSLSQVIIGDRTAADKLVIELKSGTSIEAAAASIGLEPARLSSIAQSAYAAQNSAEIAAAVFGAAKGGFVGPLKAPLGWAVVRIDSSEQIAARPLDQARGDLMKELSIEKTARAFADLRAKIEDAIADKATFAEVVLDQKLQAMSTPAVIGDGRNPDDAAATPDPLLTPIIAAGFAAEVGDDPQLVGVGADGSFALVGLDRVVPAAAPPIAALRDILLRDFTIDRARRRARVVASQVVAAVNKGQGLADALAQTGLKLQAPGPLASSRAALAANPQGAPPPLALMFSMVQKTAKLLEAPQQGGWLIVYLDKIEQRDATGQTQVINAMRADLGRSFGREYVQQFSEAVRRAVGLKKHDAVIAGVRKDLGGQLDGQP